MNHLTELTNRLSFIAQAHRGRPEAAAEAFTAEGVTPEEAEALTRAWEEAWEADDQATILPPWSPAWDTAYRRLSRAEDAAYALERTVAEEMLDTTDYECGSGRCPYCR